MNKNEFTLLDEARLVSFLELKIKEDMYLDYKVDLSDIEKKKTYKEILKDITAFCNANGGNILIGVKEPELDLSIQDQMVGISNCDERAQDLERVVASSVDPRIIGLIIKTIPLSNEKSVLAIHIPPSLNRPHMVNYNDHRTFYMRHSESSFPMSSFEIRQSIMQTLTLEENAKRYIQDKEKDIVHYYLNQCPAFILQAMPLLPLESLWDVYDNRIINIMRGDRDDYNTNFSKAITNFSLNSKTIRPTIDGIMGTSSNDDSKWQTEIHRNGYISCVHINDYNYNNDTYFVCYDFQYLFNSYINLIINILTATITDLPYIISCKYYGADKTVMLTEKPFQKNSKPYYKEVITFPLHFRQVGESFVSIADTLCKELYNAYGFKNVTE